MEKSTNDSAPTFYNYKLEDYRVYRHRPGKRYDGELCMLNVSALKVEDMKIDGILSDENGTIYYYLQGLPVETFSVGNYCDKSVHGVAGAVWVQSSLSSKFGVWYELGRPSKDYVR